MAVDFFLRMDKLQGESRDSKHKDEIEILGWTFGASQTGTSGQGGGSGTGQVEIHDVEIKKYLDRASPTLYKLCAIGDHIATADLTCRKAGGEQLEYLKVRLEEILITSYKVDGDPKVDRIVETIRLNFTRSALTYTQQTEKGQGGAPISGGWDCSKKVAWDHK